MFQKLFPGLLYKFQTLEIRDSFNCESNISRAKCLRVRQAWKVQARIWPLAWPDLDRNRNFPTHFDSMKEWYLGHNIDQYQRNCYISQLFLGLIFDRCLTFKPHIQQLKIKCLRALDLLKVLSHSDWGADKATLLMAYSSLIWSKRLWLHGLWICMLD